MDAPPKRTIDRQVTQQKGSLGEPGGTNRTIAGVFNRILESADIILFVALLTLYVWVVLPVTAAKSPWKEVFILAALGVATASTWRSGATARECGIRLDNFPRSAALYGTSALAYSAVTLFWFRERLGRPVEPWWPSPRGVAWLLLWGLLQQYCLLSFLFRRLRKILRKDLLASLTAAGIFAFFHLPNPFLTLYTLGGGIIATLLFLRWPSLPAAGLAHMVSSLLAGGLLPGDVTGWMRVGPLYGWSP